MNSALDQVSLCCAAATRVGGDDTEGARYAVCAACGEPCDRLARWQADRYRLLLAALRDVALTDADHRTLRWLAGWDAETVERLIGMFNRAREAGA